MSKAADRETGLLLYNSPSLFYAQTITISEHLQPSSNHHIVMFSGNQSCRHFTVELDVFVEHLV
jgi:hypothetical protein